MLPNFAQIVIGMVLLILVTLPLGYLCLALCGLHSSPRWQKSLLTIPASIFTGMLVLPFLYNFIGMVFSVPMTTTDRLIIMIATVGVLFALYRLFRLRSTTPRESLISWRSAGVLVLFSLILGVMTLQPIRKVGEPIGGTSDWRYRILLFDWDKHVAVTSAIANDDHLPPPNPFTVTDPQLRYYYFGYILPALVYNMAGGALAMVNAFSAQAVLIALLFPFLVYVYARDIGLSRGGALTVVFLMLIVGGLDWIYTVAHYAETGNWRTYVEEWSVYRDRGVNSFNFLFLMTPQHVLAYAGMLLILWLVRWLPDARWRSAITIARMTGIVVLIAAIIGTSTLVGVCLMAGLVLFLGIEALYALYKRQIPVLGTRLLIAVGLGMALSLPYLIFIRGREHEPLLLIISPTLRGIQYGGVFSQLFGGSELTYVLDFPFQMIPEYGVVLFVGISGLVLLLRRWFEQAEIRLWTALLAASFIILLTFRVGAGLNNDLGLRAAPTAWIILSIFGGFFVVRHFEGAKRRVRWWAVSILLLAMTVIGVINNVYDPIMYEQRPQYLLPERWRLFQWMNANLERDAVFQLYIEIYGDAMQFAERRQGLTDGITAPIYITRYEQLRRADQVVRIGRENMHAAEVADAFIRVGIDYIVVHKSAPIPSQEDPAFTYYFDTAYEDEHFMVFQVREVPGVSVGRDVVPLSTSQLYIDTITIPHYWDVARLMAGALVMIVLACPVGFLCLNLFGLYQRQDWRTDITTLPVSTMVGLLVLPMYYNAISTFFRIPLQTLERLFLCLFLIIILAGVRLLVKLSHDVSRPAMSRRHVAVLLLISAAAIYLPTTLQVIHDNPSGTYSGILTGISAGDWSKHIAVATAVATSDMLPPPNPFLSTDPELRYYYFGYIIPALVHNLSGETLGVANSTSAHAILIAGLLPFLIYAYTSTMTRSPSAGLFAALLVSLVGGLDFVYILLNYLREGRWLDHVEVWMSLRNRVINSPFVMSLWTPQHFLGFSGVVMIVWLLGQHPTGKRFRTIDALQIYGAGVLIASVAGVSIMVWIGLVAGLGAYLAFELLLSAYRRCIPLNALKTGISLFIAAIIALPFLLLLNGKQEHGLAFYVSATEPGLIYGSVFSHFFGDNQLTHTLNFPLVMIPEFGLVLLTGLGGLWLLRKQWLERSEVRLWTMMLAAGGIVVLAFRIASGLINDLSPRVGGIVWVILAILSGFWWIERHRHILWRRRPLRTLIIAALLVGLLSSGYEMFARHKHVRLFPDERHTLFQWLNQNLERDAVIYYYIHLEEDAMQFGEHRLAIVDTLTSTLYASSLAVYELQIHRLERLETIESVREAALVLSESNVDYVVFQRDNLMPSAQDPAFGFYFEHVYEDQDFRIYRLIRES